MAALAMQRMGDDHKVGSSSARFLSTKEVPGFDTMRASFVDDWSAFSSHGGDASKWAKSSFGGAMVPVLDVSASPVSRGSFALDLEGFDPKLPFSPFKQQQQQTGSGSNHRRRSSFGDLSDLKKRDSAASQQTFLSSGDSSFDDALDVLLKKKAKKGKTHDDEDEDDHIQLEEVPHKRRPDDRPPEKRRPDDRPPDKTKNRKRIQRSKTTEGLPKPSSATHNNKEHHHRKPRRTVSTDGTAMKDESEGGRSNASRLHGSKPSVTIKEDKSTKKHGEKSLGAMLKEKDSMQGSGRTHESRQHRKASKSPSRTKSKRTKDRASNTTATTTSNSRLHKSSGSLFSESDTEAASNSRLNKSSGSLELPAFHRTASLEEKAILSKRLVAKANSQVANSERAVANAINNILNREQQSPPEPRQSESTQDSRPVAVAIANILSRDDLDIPDFSTSHRGGDDSEMEESGRTHGSTRTQDSARTHDSSRSSKSPKRSTSRSPTRTSGGNKGKSSSRSERDRSRSNSRSRKNKAAAAAADTSLLGAKSEHSVAEDMDALFDEITSRDKPSSKASKSPTRHNKSRKESSMTDGSARKGLRRTKSADHDGPIMKDKSSTSRTGRMTDDSTKHRRGRRTGSVEAPRGRRQTTSTEKQQQQRGRRTGSVEAPRGRRAGSEAPKGRSRTASEAPKLRRTGSVETPRRRAPSADTRRRAPSADARGLGRRAPSVDRLRDKQLSQQVLATPEPSFPSSNVPSSDTTGEDNNNSPALPVNLPSISGLTGGEVPTWKMQGNKSKEQPRDQDGAKEQKQKEANKGRRFTQAIWKSRIKEAKSK